MGLENVMKIMSDLVEFDTTNKPGNEKPAAQYIASYLKSFGFDVELQEIDDNRANVVARIGCSENKLILTGHLDVVPAGDGWTHTPFRVTEENGRLFGRGVVDMKGAISCMIEAATRVVRDSSMDDLELILLFVADEEIDGLGSKHFLDTYVNGKRNMVVIGEATNNQINIAHRGVVRFKVEIFGKQCHAGQPENGINAITQMAKFIVAIEEENERKKNDKIDILPAPTVAVTGCNGGIKNNIITAYSSCILDFRTIPGEDVQKLQRDLEVILNGLFEGSEVTWKATPFIEVKPAMTPADSDLKLCAEEACKKVLHKEPEVTYFPACCDMSWFSQAGFDALILGPGSIKQAHTIDEYIEISELEKAVEIYKQMILQFK